MKKTLFVAATILALLPAQFAAAKSDETDVGDDEVNLGLAFDRQSKSLAQGKAYIHKTKNFAHRSGSSAPKTDDSCNKLLVRKTKWRTVEPWVMNASNTRGLDNSTLFSTQAAAISKWEDAADGIVGNSVGADIVGEGVLTGDPLLADESSPDGLNEVYFADVGSSGAIAVTIVWYNYFTKALLEWDQIYDDRDFDWSLTGEATKMDFDNIATHEDGHAVGLGDIYRSRCADETMYGYANFGETKKRTLEIGDITGINSLY